MSRKRTIRTNKTKSHELVANPEIAANTFQHYVKVATQALSSNKIRNLRIKGRAVAARTVVSLNLFHLAYQGQLVKLQLRSHIYHRQLG
jgi:hypothetical protein